MPFSGYKELNPQFAAGLQAMVNASGGRITINSGYRSVERQTQLFNDAVKKYGSVEAARKWVAPPGKSNHNHGIAADLGGDLALAQRLAPQFGLYFPMGHEPWHIEPVGSRDGRYDNQAYTPSPGMNETVVTVPVENRNDLGVQLMDAAGVLGGNYDPDAGGVLSEPVSSELVVPEDPMMAPPSTSEVELADADDIEGGVQ